MEMSRIGPFFAGSLLCLTGFKGFMMFQQEGEEATKCNKVGKYEDRLTGVTSGDE